MHPALALDGRLDELLRLILDLRECMRRLDAMELEQAGAFIDEALNVLEPLHPDVVAGRHGPRPLPDHLRLLLDGSDMPCPGLSREEREPRREQSTLGR